MNEYGVHYQIREHIIVYSAMHDSNMFYHNTSGEIDTLSRSLLKGGLL